MLRLALLTALVALGACDSAEDPPVIRLDVAGLDATGPGYTLVSLRDSARVVPETDSATTRWDLGFRGTAVIINGGTSGPGAAVGVVVEREFDTVDDALLDAVAYRRDGESPCPSGAFRAVCPGSGNGWFRDGGDGPEPIPNRTLLLRLADGRGYAKVEFQGYAEPGRYSFRYAANPAGPEFVDAL